jgi:hypothetical protein
MLAAKSGPSQSIRIHRGNSLGLRLYPTDFILPADFMIGRHADFVHKASLLRR